MIEFHQESRVYCSLKLSLEEQIFVARQMGTLGGHLMFGGEGMSCATRKTLDISLLMILMTDEIMLGYLKAYK